MKKFRGADILLFLTSFIFAGIYFASIYSYFAGVHRGFLDAYEVGIYGIDAFKDTFQLSILMLSIFGIIPFCCIYNIAFGVYKWHKKELTKFEKIILSINLALVVIGIIIFIIFL